MLATTDFNPANLAGLTQAQLYESAEALRYVMHSIGIRQVNARNKIIDDGFNSLKSIVVMHTMCDQGFKKYLNGLNKTYATASDRRQRVHFSPIAIERFSAIVFYYDQAVHSYHSIPDMGLVDADMADDLIKVYRELTSESSDLKDSDEDEDVVVPTLKGSSNWVDFRDKFLLKLFNTKSSRGFPMDYLLDTTDRPITSARSSLVPVTAVDIEDETYYKSHAILFGPHFKKDNQNLWNRMETMLLGTDCYNHISSFFLK